MEIIMARPRNREDLLKAGQENFEKLCGLVDSMTEKELSTPFDFSADEKKKEAHWKRDKNIRDVLIHLYEWHQLLIHFVDENMAGRETAFLPKPYTWKTYGAMNQFFFDKHQNTSLEDARNTSFLLTFTGYFIFRYNNCQYTGHLRDPAESLQRPNIPLHEHDECHENS